MNFQVATVIGPGLGGVIIALVGVQGVYWIDAASYLAVLTSLILINYRPVARPTRRVSIAAAAEGLQFVWSNKILISTMLLDFFATFFASSRTLLPIFVTAVLHSGEIGFGLLSAADSVVSGGIACMLVVLAIDALSPGLRKYKFEED